jgi:hypothetical protein
LLKNVLSTAPPVYRPQVVHRHAAPSMQLSPIPSGPTYTSRQAPPVYRPPVQSIQPCRTVPAIVRQSATSGAVPGALGAAVHAGVSGSKPPSWLPRPPQIPAPDRRYAAPSVQLSPRFSPARAGQVNLVRQAPPVYRPPVPAVQPYRSAPVEVRIPAPNARYIPPSIPARPSVPGATPNHPRPVAYTAAIQRYVTYKDDHVTRRRPAQARNFRQLG